MPITPFHLGWGILFKGALRERFSLGTFTLVQVVIDVESATNLLFGGWPVHGYLHSLLGALGVGAVVAALGKPWVTRLNAAIAHRLSANSTPFHSRLLQELSPVSWSAAITGALLGSVSHVLLDGIMHADVQVLLPWSTANPLLLEGSADWIHRSCVGAAAVGLLLWGLLPRGPSSSGLSRRSGRSCREPRSRV